MYHSSLDMCRTRHIELMSQAILAPSAIDHLSKSGRFKTLERQLSQLPPKAYCEVPTKTWPWRVPPQHLMSFQTPAPVHDKGRQNGVKFLEF